ncbi:hypothetical protein T06_10201 [Trichinella sp. T6]|nr:hypothetical protein T06_10201 [Trichinella sp. T6]
MFDMDQKWMFQKFIDQYLRFHVKKIVKKLMQETHQYSTDIPPRDLSTSSHLVFIRCPSDAFYLLNIPFLSMVDF